MMQLVAQMGMPAHQWSSAPAPHLGPHFAAPTAPPASDPLAGSDAPRQEQVLEEELPGMQEELNPCQHKAPAPAKAGKRKPRAKKAKACKNKDAAAKRKRQKLPERNLDISSDSGNDAGRWEGMDGAISSESEGNESDEDFKAAAALPRSPPSQLDAAPKSPDKRVRLVFALFFFAIWGLCSAHSMRLSNQVIVEEKPGAEPSNEADPTVCGARGCVHAPLVMTSDSWMRTVCMLGSLFFAAIAHSTRVLVESGARGAAKRRIQSIGCWRRQWAWRRGRRRTSCQI